MNLDELAVDSRAVAHLPLILAVIRRLGILDVIDKHCPKHVLNNATDAECVSVMTANILAGRPALYQMDRWVRNKDVELLFGDDVDPDWFNDTRMATCLDHLDKAGTDQIMTDVAIQYLRDRPGPITVHHDTTSVSLYGAYEAYDDGRSPPTASPRTIGPTSSSSSTV